MIDQETKAEIIRLYKSGILKTVIWKRTGVSRPTINSILKVANVTKEDQLLPAPERVDAKESRRFTVPFSGVSQEVSDLLTAQQREIERIQRTMETRFDELTELVTIGNTHALSVTPEDARGDNPSETPLDEAVDSVIELEEDNLVELEDGRIFSSFSVGFTQNSLKLYEREKKKGFRGNLADFVNSAIDKAMKSRKFKLVYVGEDARDDTLLI